MKVAIYVEGGGNGREGKAQLRQGFDALLRKEKDAARLRRCEWRLTMCGSRGEACRAFLSSLANNPSSISALLVDAEGPLLYKTPAGRIAYLQQRDSWQLQTVAPDAVHLMIECMEAWIVADPDALQRVYGQGFRANSLPARLDLDGHQKPDLMAALEAATKETKRGGYAKIRDASDVLLRIDPDKVATRCPSFRSFRDWLTTALQEC